MNLSIGLALIFVGFSVFACCPCAIVNVNISKTLNKNPFILIICYDYQGKTNVNKAF
jgi:hypothetical protein